MRVGQRGEGTPRHDLGVWVFMGASLLEAGPGATM